MTLTAGEALLTLVREDYYAGAFLRSLVVASVSAALCLALAYPMALGIAASREAWRVPLLALVLLPFWTGFLPRLGAWIGLLRDGRERGIEGEGHRWVLS